MCDVCGKKSEGKCQECVKSIAPDCMIRNQDLIANETWSKLHDSPYWGMNGCFKRTRSPNTGASLHFGELIYYEDTKFLYFSGTYIPTANLLDFQYDKFPQKDGTVKVTVTIETRYPNLKLTQLVSNREDPMLQKKIKNFIFRDLQTYRDRSARKDFLDYMYMKQEKQNKMPKKEVKQLSYQEAKNIYMFDDSYTLEELKKQKRRLIKAFHPDNADGDKAYAQKIVEAYEVLLEKIS